MKYTIINVGAGNVVRMQVSLNNYSTTYAITKGEAINFFLIFNLNNTENKKMKITFDYWDVGSIGDYQQTDAIILRYSNGYWKTKPEPITFPVLLNDINNI